MADKIKILMIDDEEDLCLMVKGNLEDTGEFEVVTCSQADKAVETVKSVMPDLVLLDVVMPGVKGPDIVAALKKAPETKAIPVVMVSGKGEMVYNKKKDDFKWVPNSDLVKERGALPDVKGAEALSQAYGVADYVSKPFSTDILIQVVKDVIARTNVKSEGDEGPQVGV